MLYIELFHTPLFMQKGYFQNVHIELFHTPLFMQKGYFQNVFLKLIPALAFKVL